MIPTRIYCQFFDNTETWMEESNLLLCMLNAGVKTIGVYEFVDNNNKRLILDAKRQAPNSGFFVVSYFQTSITPPLKDL